jgi:hypothetical protein
MGCFALRKTWDKELFLYVNGLKVLRSIQLDEDVELLPASGKYNPNFVLRHITNDIDMGILILFMGSIYSQIKINNNSMDLAAKKAINALWDINLLSGLYDNEMTCNIQSNKPYENIEDDDCLLGIMNYHIISCTTNFHTLSEDEAIWIETNIGKARKLLENDKFLNAVHCLASYKWHPLPRAQLAIIWAGIEGIFGIKNEISSRLSLCISNFLSSSRNEKKEMFEKIRELYKNRSTAVHGSKLKNDINKIINDSVFFLRELIFKCINDNIIPDKNSVVQLIKMETSSK